MALAEARSWQALETARVLQYICFINWVILSFSALVDYFQEFFAKFSQKMALILELYFASTGCFVYHLCGKYNPVLGFTFNRLFRTGFISGCGPAFKLRHIARRVLHALPIYA